MYGNLQRESHDNIGSDTFVNDDSDDVRVGTVEVPQSEDTHGYTYSHESLRRRRDRSRSMIWGIVIVIILVTAVFILGSLSGADKREINSKDKSPSSSSASSASNIGSNDGFEIPSQPTAPPTNPPTYNELDENISMSFRMISTTKKTLRKKKNTMIKKKKMMKNVAKSTFVLNNLEVDDEAKERKPDEDELGYRYV